MISPKKLVALFLSLAAITSSSVLFFSSPKISNVDLNREDLEKQTAQNQLLNLGENAFVESIPSSQDLSQGLAITNLSGNTSNNLTGDLADNLARELVAANPEGPQDTDGQTSIVAPDADKLLDTVNISNEDLKKLIAEKWKISTPENKIKVINNYSADDVLAYSESLGKIFQENFADLQARLPAELDQGISPETINSLGVAVQKTDLDLEKISVPAIALDFHKSFLTLLAHQKNGLALLDETEDPLKTALLIQSQEQNYFEAVQNFEQEFKKLSSLKQFSLEKQNKFLAGFVGLFTIKQAHALFGVDGLITVARMIWEWLRKVAVELLKNQLIHQLVQQTIKWIQGEGKPQFLTNWKSFITKAGQDAAASAIYKILPGVCESFGPLIKVQLQSIYNTDSSSAVTCTLKQIVANIQQFYDSFSDGGWVAYGASALPSGNYFGSLFEVNQIVSAKAAATKEAAGAESGASQGFLGTKVCASQNTQDVIAILGNNAVFPLTEDQAISAARLIGEDYIKGSFRANGIFKSCPKDGWQTTTPGVALGRVVDNALGAPIHRIVNSQDIIGLVAALINSVLNKLLLSGQQGLTGPTITSGSGSSKPPNPKAAFTQEAYTILSNKQTVIGMYDRLIVVASSTVDILLQARIACADEFGIPGIFKRQRIEQEITNWTNKLNEWRQNQARFQTEVDNLEDFINAALNPQPPPADQNAENAYYTQKINELHTTYGTAQQSEADVNELQNALTNPDVFNAIDNAKALLNSCL